MATFDTVLRWIARLCLIGGIALLAYMLVQMGFGQGKKFGSIEWRALAVFGTVWIAPLLALLAGYSWAFRLLSVLGAVHATMTALFLTALMIDFS